jgi:hypothetical protein
MQLICTRSVPVVDFESLECRQAKEALFRDGDRYVLCLMEQRTLHAGRSG